MPTQTQLLDGLDLFSDPRVVDAGTADGSCVISENPATGQPIAAPPRC